jgi:hypothetical protein
MATNVDLLTPQSRNTYGINLPENAWPGASDDIVIATVLAGGKYIQIGSNYGEAQLYSRNRDYNAGGPWSAWAQWPAPEPEPPAPEAKPAP